MAAKRQRFSILGLVLVLASTTLVSPGAPQGIKFSKAPGNAGTVDFTRGASYSNRTSPLFYEEQMVVAPDGAEGDEFGYSVALSGDTAVVSAHASISGDQGSIYIFVYNGATWVLQQELTASDGYGGDWFGFSVAISGDTALVGAPGAVADGNTMGGAAYVFTRNGATWTEQAKLTAPDGGAFLRFGSSVALSGNTALVGMPNAAIGSNYSQGAAYVFIRKGTTWSFQQKLVASDGAAHAGFGFSVALEGDTALVGASDLMSGGYCILNSAYVFTRVGTAWNQQAQLTASDGAAGDCFASSVALSHNTALVGAFGDDIGSNTYQGSAYIYIHNGTTWTQQAKLTASDGEAYDEFGWSIALYNDMALVGAPIALVGTNYQQGAAYIFTRSGETWSQQTKLTALNGGDSDKFGTVSLSGVNALVGAYNATGNTAQGKAYFYRVITPFSTYLPVVTR